MMACVLGLGAVAGDWTLVASGDNASYDIARPARSNTRMIDSSGHRPCSPGAKRGGSLAWPQGVFSRPWFESFHVRKRFRIGCAATSIATRAHACRVDPSCAALIANASMHPFSATSGEVHHG